MKPQKFPIHRVFLPKPQKFPTHLVFGWKMALSFFGNPWGFMHWTIKYFGLLLKKIALRVCVCSHFCVLTPPHQYYKSLFWCNLASKSSDTSSFFAEASKISDAFSFWVKNGLEFFWRLSFFGLEFFENVQKISLAYIGNDSFWGKILWHLLAVKDKSYKDAIWEFDILTIAPKSILRIRNNLTIVSFYWNWIRRINLRHSWWI